MTGSNNRIPFSNHDGFTRNVATLATCCLLTALLCFQSSLQSAEAQERGFVPIFNGIDLKGWDGKPGAWEVRDGAIWCTGTSKEKNWLIWRGGEPADFVLRLEFRWDEGNSGLQVRSDDLGDHMIFGYQVEIARQKVMGLWHHSLLDADHPKREARHLMSTAGEKAFIDEQGNRKNTKMADTTEIQSHFKEHEWNTMEIIAKGDTLIQRINGVHFATLIDKDKELSRKKGWIALQDHGKGCTVAFRDIRIKESKPDEHVLLNFETNDSIKGNNRTHKSTISLVEDAPDTGGTFAAKTFIDPAAKASSHFGTGFAVSDLDISSAGEIRFWIKTDIESGFNFQIHSKVDQASVFGFSTIGSEIGKWKQFTAPLQRFKQPPWANQKADLKHINKIQITAFGKGPYDEKHISIDHVTAHSSNTSISPEPQAETTPEKRGGPITNVPSKPSKPKSPPAGFRSLFDGKTFDGWKAYARIPVPHHPGAEFKWQLKGDALKKAKQNKGRWIIEDGAIVGGQEPPGSGKGAYLVSEEKFGDFELVMDMKPDWMTDSGFLIRTLPEGSPGMQVLVDHRPQGGIGGFYGNGIAGVHGMPFAIDAEYDKDGNPTKMIAADPTGERVELNKKTRAILTYAADVEDFLKVWKWGKWNTIKVRSVGRIPKLTTWVNGLKIAELDMANIDWEDYDPEACAAMMGRKGHISLEVHNSNLNHWLGKARWWPGAVVRWKNIFIRELD